MTDYEALIDTVRKAFNSKGTIGINPFTQDIWIMGNHTEHKSKSVVFACNGMKRYAIIEINADDMDNGDEY